MSIGLERGARAVPRLPAADRGAHWASMRATPPGAGARFLETCSYGMSPDGQGRLCSIGMRSNVQLNLVWSPTSPVDKSGLLDVHYVPPWYYMEWRHADCTIPVITCITTLSP